MRIAVKEMIPDPMRATLEAWLREAFGVLRKTGAMRANSSLVSYVQSALQLDLGIGVDGTSSQGFARAVFAQGDQITMQVVDLFVNMLSENDPWGVDGLLEQLQLHLDLNVSSVTISSDGHGRGRIALRLPEGVETIAAAAADGAVRSAGEKLAKAWQLATQFEADPSGAMTYAIRAVEAAAGPVVSPRDGRQQLGRMVAVIRGNEACDLVFDRRDDEQPHMREVLLGIPTTNPKSNSVAR